MSAAFSLSGLSQALITVHVLIEQSTDRAAVLYSTYCCAVLVLLYGRVFYYPRHEAEQLRFRSPALASWQVTETSSLRHRALHVDLPWITDVSLEVIFIFTGISCLMYLYV